MLFQIPFKSQLLREILLLRQHADRSKNIRQSYKQTGERLRGSFVLLFLMHVVDFF